MRVAVYLDQGFWREGDGVYAARSFVKFLGRLAEEFDELTVTARLSPQPSGSHYRLPEPARFAPLPHYGSAADPRAVARAWRESVRRFEALLDRVDAVWLLGPHPFAIAFVRIAARRGKRVVLGVRQDFPRYVRNRRPGRPDLHLAANAMETAFRRAARRHPVVVVGPALAADYARSPRLLEIYVSLIAAEDIVPPAAVAERDYDRTVRLLSVGRLDPEKNPLMLAEVVDRLDERFELTVCGDGPLETDLAAASAERGLQNRLHLRGHVPMGPDLLALYRSSHELLHVSWSEGFPQVLLEGFAAALPTVATDVGGIAAAAGGTVELIPPGDPDAAVAAIRRLADDREERARLVEAGSDFVRDHTIDREVDRVAEFIRNA